jgi:hypothetical protein
MAEIGRRAAEEIRQASYNNDTTLQFELDCIGVSREMLYCWEHKKWEPTGKKLAGMALAGYDIYYILTGERKQVC